MAAPWTRRIGIALVCAGLSIGLGAAASTRVKLATLAPDGSPWHKLLEQMGSEWQQGTDGRVRLVIYPGGVAGSDPDTLRKMRIGQLQAAGLTVEGLARIDTAFLVFSIPLFFDSFDEYAHVLEKMTPTMRVRLESKGFVLLHWGHGGWIHIFSKDPVRTVEELRRVKMFTPAGDDRMVRVWQSNGFRPVAVSTTDVLYGLKTGLLEGVPAPPLGALALQWFRHTPYMLDVGVAPLVGANVMTSKAWKEIGDADRAVVLESASRAQERLALEIPEKDRASVEEMTRRGLTVIHVDETEREKGWNAAASAFADGMKSMIPDDVYEEALRYRTEFRESLAAEASP